MVRYDTIRHVTSLAQSVQGFQLAEKQGFVEKPGFKEKSSFDEKADFGSIMQNVALVCSLSNCMEQEALQCFVPPFLSKYKLWRHLKSHLPQYLGVRHPESISRKLLKSFLDF